jgi:hypothetical protein
MMAPVGAEYCVLASQAACWYSLMSPMGVEYSVIGRQDKSLGVR